MACFKQICHLKKFLENSHVNQVYSLVVNAIGDTHVSSNNH
jgi:hypothetical protein